MRVHRKHRRTRAVAGMAAVAMLTVAACGSDDDSDSTDEESTSDDTAADDTAADDTGSDDSESADTEADEDSPDSVATDDSEADEESDDADSDTEAAGAGDEGEPVQGGDLVYGIEADTANAWAPYAASYAPAGYVPLAALSDSLFAADEEGETLPLLVESWEANDDFTEWTFNIREGVSFHDGTALDGAAVEFNIETCQYSPLTGAALAPIADVSSEGQTVTIATNGPQVAIPYLFTYGACAYMMSPEWLGSLPDVPQRVEALPIYDADLAATPGDGNPQEPVGVGAFVFDSYTPGNGNSFVAVRNEDYWRGPNGVTGEELPYLDSIEAVVAVDVDSRANALRSGQFDVIHTSNTDTVAQFIDDDSLETLTSSKFGETNYIMLNVAEGEDDPGGVNADSPMLNVHCRRALAFATDTERLAEERGAGLVDPANGPFGPAQLGYLEDSGYPTYDPDEANAELDQCLADLGTDSIEFSFNTTNDPFNVETNTLMISIWQETFGDRVNATIEPIEQGQYIGLALTGAFNAFAWRSHSGIDPASQALWWQSVSSAPIGELALNFGRFRDENIDAALATIQADPDPATRQEAAEEINRIFGEQVYNLWTTWTVWGILEQPYVNGVEANVTPESEDGVGLAFAGRHQMNQLWCDEGTCE